MVERKNDFYDFNDGKKNENKRKRTRKLFLWWVINNVVVKEGLIFGDERSQECDASLALTFLMLHFLISMCDHAFYLLVWNCPVFTPNVTVSVSLSITTYQVNVLCIKW